MQEIQSFTENAIELLWQIIPDLILAIVVLLAGLWIIKVIAKVADKGMTRSNLDPSLAKFVHSFISIGLKVLLLISVASMLGIATASFVAILGAIGLAVGLALQGSLANFAGGVLILIFKPFKVGDVIDAQGFTAIVHEIQIFNTILKSFDNKTIIIPNGPLSNGSITNFSTEQTRRVDMKFGIGYADDIHKTKNILKDLIDADERILREPEPVVVLSELGDSSVNFTVRVWSNAADFWGIYFDMQEKVKAAFDKQGISIPFPQQDVHLYQHKK